jgi:hypothetical protein
MEYLGNQELLKLKKTAFLASTTIPLDMVLKCYDWAAGRHEDGGGPDTRDSPAPQ